MNVGLRPSVGMFQLTPAPKKKPFFVCSVRPSVARVMLSTFAVSGDRLKSVPTSAVVVVARLLDGKTLQAALPPAALYQRGQFWLRRFRAQAEALSVALALLTEPAPAPDFVHRALAMLESSGWVGAHRFLFADLRQHLLGWPPSLTPGGRRRTLAPAATPA